MKLHRLSILLALGALCLLIGCQEAKKKKKSKENQEDTANLSLPGGVSPDMPLARINNVVITIEDFQKEIDRQAPHIRARYSSPGNMQTLLDAMVRFELLAQEAGKRGYKSDPEVQRTTKQAMIEKLYRSEFGGKTYKPSEDEIKKYYDDNKDDFAKPARVRVAAIITKSKSKARKVAKEAKALAPTDNKSFRELVEQHSKDASSLQRGGDLGYFDKSTDAVAKAVIKAAFELPEDGSVAGPVYAKGRYYIIRRTGFRPRQETAFEDAKRTIEAKLVRSKRRAARRGFVDTIKKSATIEKFPDRLNAVTVGSGSKGTK